MPALQVRDFPEKAYDLLRIRARANGRSINQETKMILVDFLEASQHFAGSVEKKRPSEPCSSESSSGAFPVYDNPWSLNSREEEEIARRTDRRKAIFSRVETRRYPDLSDMDLVDMIHEMRDDR